METLTHCSENHGEGFTISPENQTRGNPFILQQEVYVVVKKKKKSTHSKWSLVIVLCLREVHVFCDTDSDTFVLCGLQSQCFEIQTDQNLPGTDVNISPSDANMRDESYLNVCLSK